MTDQTFRNRSPYRARSMRQGGQFVPQQLVLAALYDANNGGSATQITDSSGNGLDALAFGATTAAPTYLAYAGVPYLFTPAVTGSQVSCPDIAAFGFTGDQDIRWCGTLADWTPAANTGLIAQDSGGAGGRRFTFFLTSAGKLSLIWSTDGTAVIQKTSTADLPFAANATGCVRVTLDVDDGSSQNVVRFYHKTGSTRTELAANTGWTLLDTVTTAGATSVSGVSSVALRVASSGALAAATTFTHAALYLDGIDGTIVADFDASLCAQAGYTSAAGNVWTVAYTTSGLCCVVKSQAASDVASGVLADGSNDTATGPVAAIPDLTASDSCTLYTVARPRATMTANMTFFSTRSGAGAGVTLRMASATTVVADVSDGTSTATTPAVTITPGLRYVLGVIVDAAGTARCFANNTLGSTVARTGNDETGGALTVFSNSTPANHCKTHARIAYAAAARAFTAVDLSNLTGYYGGGV